VLPDFNSPPTFSGVSALPAHQFAAVPADDANLIAARLALKRHWGYDQFRPLQEQAITAALAGRDTLTVLPTGGGKSLCFQIPPLVSQSLTLVVSPLIALMDDQVASLRLAGIPAAALHSNATESELAKARAALVQGSLRLLYVAPERLVTPAFLNFIAKLRPGQIAIDEAHCISQWGHDFRPEYRRLRDLRKALPDCPIGAYTATATPRVQQDIIDQLQLRAAVPLVGGFDRPNLTYRIQPKVRVVDQAYEAICRHRDQASIIYCISRKETEQVATALASKGLSAKPYHAGLPAATRHAISKAFRDEELDVVVATVAFGMGIDRGDVRLVVHAAMPKSIEAYQQETGRAGRDGLPAECLLLYSAGDVIRWKQLMERSNEDIDPSDTHQHQSRQLSLAMQFEMLEQMHRFVIQPRCRHRALVEHFGQSLEGASCNACDFCLHELTEVSASAEVAAKIISCIARMQVPCGAGHIADVLTGSRSAKISQRGHDQLTTHGILKSYQREQIVSFIHQLIDAGALKREEGEYPVITLGPAARDVLKSDVSVKLIQPRAIPRKPAKGLSQDGVTELSASQRELYENLRALRKDLARERAVPPYVIFSDVTLEQLALHQPTSEEELLQIRGIGRTKAADFGPKIMELIGLAQKR
jgi:ATP-dependent DNA helicase RecQ